MGLTGRRTNTRPGMIMPTNMPAELTLHRLFQIISPSLPIGGYSYSQGIEWAVETGWIKTEQEVKCWLQGLIETTMRYQELPVLIRFMQAWSCSDDAALSKWNEWLIASRETRELREEEKNRARAFSKVILSLDETANAVEHQLIQSQLACFSYACHRWQIEKGQACSGFAWSWLENLVLSAVKIIPLGQTAGQRLMFELSESLPGIIQQALLLDDDDLGCSSLALSIASTRHETQYSRLFRS